MLAEEITVAINNLTYDRSGTKEERSAAHLAYLQQVSRLELDFRTHLEDSYLYDVRLSNLRDIIYKEALARSDGSGYHSLESYYSDVVDYTLLVLANR